MRLSHLFPLAALSFAAVPASAASVAGEAKVILGGEAARCIGVALVPRTAASERSIVQMFGTVSPASRTLSPAEMQARRNTDALRDKEARCSYGSGYSFSNVAPGDYFVLLHARSKTRGPTASTLSEPPVNDRGFRDLAVLLMQPVQVSAQGLLVQSDFRYK
jgi:hypothetical protein